MTGDEEIDRDLRSRLHARYIGLARDHKTEQLTAPTTRQEGPPDDPTLLDELPTIRATDLGDLPEQLLRDLYDSFILELRYQAASHSVVVRVTVRADRIAEIRTTIDQAAARRHRQRLGS